MQPEVFASALGGGLGCTFALLAMAFFTYCFWRIIAKAGFSGAWALLCLLPIIGLIVVVCFLAFFSWPSKGRE